MSDVGRGKEAAGVAAPATVPAASPRAGIPVDPSAIPFSDDERQSFSLRVGLFYAALFLIYGIQLPYLPVWLDWRGLTASEIGVVTAAPFFVRLLVSPALALHADQTGTHRQMIVLLAASAVLAGLALALSPGFWTILAAAVALALAITSIMPLVEAVAVSGVRSGGLDYGRMRLWGSVSFVVATFAGGALIERIGAAAGVWMLLGGAVATTLAALLLPKPRLAAVTADRPKVRFPRVSDATALLRSRVFLAFLVATGAIQGAHAAFYTFGALNWQAQGISSTMIGALWTIGVAAEIALFAWSGWVMERVWATTLLIAGAIAATLRWTAMAFDPPLALLIPLQLLHGLTYGAAHLGAIHFIARAIPDASAGTAQALYATVAAGVAMGLSTLLAAQIYGRLGGSAAYLAMAVIALAGLCAAIAVRRLWDGERLSADRPAPVAAAIETLPPEQG